MTTSGFASSSSAGMSADIGTAPPSGSEALSDRANFSRTPTGSRSGAPATAPSTTCPMFPEPLTTTRIAMTRSAYIATPWDR